MAESHLAVDIQTGEAYRVSSPEPNPVATRFLEISDAIWKETSSDWMMSSWTVDSVLPVQEARDEVNCVLSSIDDSLVLAGTDRTVTLPGSAPDYTVALGPETFGTPSSVKVGTRNFDSNGTARFIDVDGEPTGVRYTDGHTDYVRELFIGMVFEDGFDANELRYTISRTEEEQDKTSSLGFKIFTSQLLDMVYEGNQITSVPLSEEQEATMLVLMQKIGGITLPEKPYI